MFQLFVHYSVFLNVVETCFETIMRHVDNLDMLIIRKTVCCVPTSLTEMLKSQHFNTIISALLEAAVLQIKFMQNVE